MSFDLKWNFVFETRIENRRRHLHRHSRCRLTSILSGPCAYGTFRMWIWKLTCIYHHRRFVSFYLNQSASSNGNPKLNQTKPNSILNLKQKINYLLKWSGEHDQSGCHSKSINHNIIGYKYIILYVSWWPFFGEIIQDDPFLALLFFFPVVRLISTITLLSKVYSSSCYFCIA